jgi:hypothetical protein
LKVAAVVETVPPKFARILRPVTPELTGVLGAITAELATIDVALLQVPAIFAAFLAEPLPIVAAFLSKILPVVAAFLTEFLPIGALSEAAHWTFRLGGLLRTGLAACFALLLPLLTLATKGLAHAFAHHRPRHFAARLESAVPRLATLREHRRRDRGRRQ